MFSLTKRLRNCEFNSVINAVNSGTDLIGVAVACLDKNMESHVLKRQSNNKRYGRQAGPLATLQFNEATVPSHRV